MFKTITARNAQFKGTSASESAREQINVQFKGTAELEVIETAVRTAATTSLPEASLEQQKVGGPMMRKHTSSSSSNPLHNLNMHKVIAKCQHVRPTVNCAIRSLHGYSSLRMFQAKPRACMNKVRG